MPDLRARETNLRNQIEALDNQLADREAYLKLASDLEGFLTQLHAKAELSTVGERQRVLRLLVKDVLVGPDKITIRHRIPIRERATANAKPAVDADTEDDHARHCPLRWGRDRTPLRGSGHLAPYHSVAHHPRAQHRAHQLEHGLVADTFLDRLHQPFMRNRRKRAPDLLPVSRTFRLG